MTCNKLVWLCLDKLLKLVNVNLSKTRTVKRKHRSINVFYNSLDLFWYYQKNYKFLYTNPIRLHCKKLGCTTLTDETKPSWVLHTVANRRFFYKKCSLIPHELNGASSACLIGLKLKLSRIPGKEPTVSAVTLAMFQRSKIVWRNVFTLPRILK